MLTGQCQASFSDCATGRLSSPWLTGARRCRQLMNSALSCAFGTGAVLSSQATLIGHGQRAAARRDRRGEVHHARAQPGRGRPPREGEGVEVVDLRFCDLPGLMQHFSIPAHGLTEDDFSEGFGFDGSSIRGFQQIHESDMILLPDPSTALIDPFRQHETLNLNCFVHDPLTLEPYSRDPRYVAKKAEAHVKSTGVADTSYFGPEAEFFIFDDVRFSQDQHSAFYQVDSVEGIWNSAREEGPNLGYKPRYKEGYFPVPPMDHFQDLRSEMILTMERMGIEIEVQHHEVGTAGQAEIDMRFDTLLRMADKLMLYKYIVKSVACQPGSRRPLCRSRCSTTTDRACTCTRRCGTGASRCFTPRAPTRGCPTWGGGTSAASSCTARRPRLRRADDQLLQAARAGLRGTREPGVFPAEPLRRLPHPCVLAGPKAKRVEFRCPDPSCNPYLAFSAILMAGLDGVANKTEPPAPVDHDLFDMSAESLPRSARCRRRSKRRWTLSRPTTTSSRRAASLRRTSSRPGSITSAPTRWTPSGFGRTRGSSCSTTTSSPAGRVGPVRRCS